MPRLEARSDALKALLVELAAQHDVPGAALAILTDGETIELASGITSTEDGNLVTPDTRFLIASITKPWTATMAMQLVDEGLIGLDDPIRDYLPGFRVADEEAAERITLRHLLANTAGFEELPRAGSLEAFAKAMAVARQVTAPGDAWSYSSGGFRLVGRLIEVLTGMAFEDVLRQRLFEPLGLTASLCVRQDKVRRPEDVGIERAAIGHESGDYGQSPVPVWCEGSSPTGTIFTTGGELLAFARMHLNDGTAADGRRVLAAESARAMREPQVECGGFFDGDEWGLGWWLTDHDRHAVFGHHGWQAGQTSVLQVVPDLGFAVAVLTNAESGFRMLHAVVEAVLLDLFAIRVTRLPPPSDRELGLDLTRYVGRYERGDEWVEVQVGTEGLIYWSGEGGGGVTGVGTDLVPIDATRFRTQPPSPDSDPVTFTRFGADGKPAHMHLDVSLLRRVDRAD